MRPPSIRYLLFGSLLFLLAGMAVTVGLPALDEAPPSALAVRYTPQEERGRAIYLREGCGYCHTQQVRAVEVERGTVHVRGDIGPESAPGDYAFQKPVLWGTSRQGPDLSHVAGRPPGNSREWQLQHLAEPQRFNPGTVMPSFRHLPREELDALADYLMTLR
ncbi:MAG: cbb3-type cytochrome c oxidase subunit II [Chloroflexi bacterium]|nr:cbb3-type cytochrome c oxidase subunit II [Chloroflexota bacterium]